MNQGPDKRLIRADQIGNIGRVFLKRTAGGVASWLKAQAILFFITLATLMIGLALLDISWWGIKAILIAGLDILPLIGSGLIMIPWAIIKVLGGEGTVALWLIVIYLILVISRQILEPIIVGRSIGLKPIWTFLATVIGIILLGPIGAIVGAIAAILIRVVLTIREDLFNGRFNEPPTGPGNAGREPDDPLSGSVDSRRYNQAKDAGSDTDLP